MESGVGGSDLVESEVGEVGEDELVGLSKGLVRGELFDLVPGVKELSVVLSVEDSLVNLEDGCLFGGSIVVSLEVYIDEEGDESDLDLEIVVLRI